MPSSLFLLLYTVSLSLALYCLAMRILSFFSNNEWLTLTLGVGAAVTLISISNVRARSLAEALKLNIVAGMCVDLLGSLLAVAH